MSSWGTVKDGCPQCCGDLKWFECSSDCRGNPGVSSLTCLGEGCALTEEQQSAFWRDLSAKKQAEWDALVERDRAAEKRK